MIGNAITYLSAHPVLTGLLLMTVVLAIIGLWYVVYNHFQAIFVTLLCGAGLLAGFVVLYRGIDADMRDLMVIGLFLVLAFPVIFTQAIRTQKKIVQLPHYPGVKLPGQGAPASPAAKK